jgi:hypothetical protein
MPSPLDPFLPSPQVRERFETTIRAPAWLVMEEAIAFDLQSIAPVRAIFRLREGLMGARPSAPRKPQGLLREMQALGWGVLERTPERVLCGAACQPWKADVVFTPIPAERFARWAEQGMVKIAWTIEVESIGPALTRLVQETRAVATDDDARRRFRRYWRWARFGIVAIRRLLMPAVRRAAERRFSTGLLADSPPPPPPKPCCASGTGKAPLYLAWIPSPESGELVLSDRSRPIRYRSEAELIQTCEELARRRVAFGVQGLGGPGPADVMAWWQVQGRMPVSFLQISWKGPDEWLLYEIVPGTQEWEICAASDLIAKPARLLRP